MLDLFSDLYYICTVKNYNLSNFGLPFLPCPEQTLQVWMNKYGWKEVESNLVLIANQEETVKTKNITEKIEFDSVAGIMAACR